MRRRRAAVGLCRGPHERGAHETTGDAPWGQPAGVDPVRRSGGGRRSGGAHGGEGQRGAAGPGRRPAAGHSPRLAPGRQGGGHHPARRQGRPARRRPFRPGRGPGAPAGRDLEQPRVHHPGRRRARLAGGRASDRRHPGLQDHRRTGAHPARPGQTDARGRRGGGRRAGRPRTASCGPKSTPTRAAGGCSWACRWKGPGC
jgi:hypothetical protein